MEEKSGIKIGVWAFIIGSILAIVVALISGANAPNWAIIVLAVLGILVGVLNVTATEVQKFLVAAIAFLLSFQSLSNVFSTLAGGWAPVGAFFGLISVFMAPAAAVVAIKALYSLAKN
ncbi:MAG: hypothetical protein V1866_04335 [archaeon]